MHARRSPHVDVGSGVYVLISMLMCSPGSGRAGRPYAHVSFAYDNGVERGGALRVPVAREFRSPLVVLASLFHYFACCRFV